MLGEWRIWAGLLVILALGPSMLAEAQAQERHWLDEAWTRIVAHRGVVFSYIFYREADNANNGVVVRLINENDHAVRYRFGIVFRAGNGAEHIERVEGTLQARQMKTGDNDGLFWVPFADGRSIGEVGLRGYEVERVGK